MKPIQFASALIFGVRLVLTVCQFATNSVGGFILGLLSSWALVTTGMAWKLGQPDTSWRAMVVGGGYFAVLTLNPARSTHPIMVLWLWEIVILQVIVRLYLGARCTITGPVFVSLQNRGPYSVVRHPLTALESVIACTIALSNPTMWNLCAIVVVLAIKVVMIEAEETFLATFPEYQAYRREVPWRIIPRVY